MSKTHNIITEITMIFMLQIIFCNPNFAQDNYYQERTRQASIQTDSGEVSFYLLTKKINPDPEFEKTYYWFNKGNLNITQGNYSGYLLDGKYIHYSKNQKLIVEKGMFEDGLKTGDWYSWSENGQLASYCQWENGMKNGVEIIYESQKIISKSQYKNNMLMGWQLIYDGDTIKSRVKYSNNEPVDNNETFFKRLNIFKKNEDVNRDSIVKNDSTAVNKSLDAK